MILLGMIFRPTARCLHAWTPFDNGIKVNNKVVNTAIQNQRRNHYYYYDYWNNNCYCCCQWIEVKPDEKKLKYF